eukprot:TRINITY_DN9507_c0_g2_i2.p1 TRINITY_DN9507_c0_g2~~TRINITY_DN9507_c0_g2_i2.p1  ORF type:complete len:115 (-),score=28.73 TRINITY_DN9507_c0_g2_i2:99-443(-)
MVTSLVSSRALLHTMAAKYPIEANEAERQEMKTFLELFGKFYPCEECSGHLLNYFEKHPIPTEGRNVLSRYLCRIHNVLNKYLKKPAFDCELLEETYGGECSECKAKTLFVDDL